MTDTREPYYVTTAIFYPAPRPALHSMFEAVGADAIARYQRLSGRDVRFLTGMDEHSANVERAAREGGVDPRALIDPWAETWRGVFDRYRISADRFIRTTDPDHAVAASEMVRRAVANGDVYEGVYSGWFCNGCNEFKTDQQLVDGRCPDHPTVELAWLEESNFFFRLSAYQEPLERLYAENPSFCEPEHFRNEVLGWLREGLRDFSISRSGTAWGIPFPGNEAHRIYVWFDALTNYLTGAGFPDDPDAFGRWWPADLHVIGKNITRFHCLYWPAMLMSAGLPLPKQVFAHGFMLDRGERMSKTRGNVRDAEEAADLFGVDGIRYVVLREVPFERDADVTFDGFVRRYNADLANDLGNLVNRTVSMTNRYLDGHLPPVADATEAADRDQRAAAEQAVITYRAAMERHHLAEAMAAMMELAGAANGYAESQAPWSLNKAGETERTGRVLAVLAESCRIIGHLLAPVAPAAARRLHEQLGAPAPYDERGAGGPGWDVLARWGAGPQPWTTSRPTPIFPRIERENGG
ncbi:MAG TPA: methionine--tRNA ligase [Candidatus Limnocylindrales bacterium]|nr:methionine--tRNA ligase [Candidatus Limnocylindrales bacterium]